MATKVSVSCILEAEEGPLVFCSRLGYRQQAEERFQNRRKRLCFCGLQYFTTTNKLFVVKVESSGGNIQSLNLFRALCIVLFFSFFLSFSVLVQKNILIVT